MFNYISISSWMDLNPATDSTYYHVYICKLTCGICNLCVVYLQPWVVRTTETWTSRPVRRAVDIIAVAAPVDRPFRTAWIIRVRRKERTNYKIETNYFRFHSATRIGTRYQSLDRGGLVDVHDREFIPIREPRDRSRDRSLERGLYLEDELYGRSARQSPNPMSMPGGGGGDRGYLGELHHQNSDLQRELGNLKRELDLTNQKLGSSMHSIKTFWSPELKKERALRKEESAKYSLINDQLKLLNSENQVRDAIWDCVWVRFGLCMRLLSIFLQLIKRVETGKWSGNDVCPARLMRCLI